MRIRQRLILWFIWGCLLPMLLIGYVAYKRFEQSTLQASLGRLEALAADRASELDNWVADQSDHLGLLAASPAIADCADQLEQQLRRYGPNSADYRAQVGRCHATLRGLEQLGSLDDLLLIAPDGLVTYSAKHKADFGANLLQGSLAHTRLSRMIRNLPGKSGLYFVPHDAYPPAGGQAAFWLAPLRQGDTLHGFLAIRLNNRVFDRISHNYLGLGQTGESLIVRAEPSGVALLLAPLRHRPDAAFRLHISPQQQAGQAMWQVLAGASGSGHAIDYRGVPVLAAWQPVPSLGLAVILKRDEADALAAVREHRNDMVLLLLLVSLCCSGVAFWRASKLVSPVNKLMDASLRIARGKWATRLPPLGSSEFGVLGHTFNVMAEQIERSQQLSKLQLEEAERMAQLGYCIAYRDQAKPLEWSEQLYQILEHPADRPPDMAYFLSLIHPDDLPRVLQAHAANLPGGYQVSYRLCLPDGRKKYLHEVGRHEAGAGGEVARRVSVVQDITAAELMSREVAAAQQALEQERLARAEEAASHAEAKAQAILQAMGEGVLGLAADGRVVFCNPAAAMMLGVSSEELNGSQLDDQLYHYNTYGLRQVSPSPLLRALQQSLPCSSHQELFGSARRERFPVFYQLNMLTQPIGELCAVLLFRDITLQRASEMRLEQMSRAVTQSPVGVLITDPQGLIEFVNPRLLQMSGYEEHELLGQLPAILRSEQTSPQTYAELWQKLLSGESWHGEWLNRHKDGHEYWVMQMVSPVRDAAGRMTHYVSVQEDITAQKQLEQRLQEAVATAESATAAKSAFLANMSHEIRTPMNAIIGMADLALRDDLPPRAQDFLGKVVRSARSLLGIINDILDFSKIESGHLQIEQAPFALEEVLAPLADMLAMRLDGRPLELVFDVAPEVPEHWQGDALRLGQVLLNLLGNAVKFTASGSVLLRVRWDGRLLHFAVVDTGIGMTSAQQARLFVPFSQADISTQRRYGGTGLGLVISGQLVQLMGGGQIKVESQAGAGSTLSFSLPLQARAAPVQPEVAAGTLYHALLAPATRDALQALCRQQGIACRAVASRDELLALLPQLAAQDALLLDANAPERFALVRDIEWPAHAQVILLGRTPQCGDEAGLLAAGVPLRDEWLKPLTRGRLLHGLQRLWQPQDAIARDHKQLPRLDGCHVLVVDDVPLNQEVAAAYLQEAGASVSFAANGVEALQALQLGLPDAVLMDCHMPVMDGFVATQQIRANPAWRALKIIALTANALSGSREEVLAAGMDDYISKPIDPARLFAVLAQAGLQARSIAAVPATAPVRSAPPAAVVTATAESGSADDEWQQLAAAGVNVEEGTARAVGMPHVYRKWLLLFASNMASFADDSQAALQAGDGEQLQRLVHTLCGAAGNVSADEVARQAGAMEQAIRQGVAIATLAPQLAQLQQQLSAVRQAVAALAATVP